MTKTWFDIDGTVPAVAIYTGDDDAPMYAPEDYIGTRTKFSTKFDYIPFVPAKKIEATVSIPGTVTVPDGSTPRRIVNLGPHGVDGVPFVYGFVIVGSDLRPLCGTVPIHQNLTTGNFITFTLVVDATNVYIVEYRTYPAWGSAPASRDVVIFVSDKIVLGDEPDPPADFVDVAENYLVAGDFDSRKRYLKQGGSSDLAIASGVTWSVGGSASLSGDNNTAWKWSLDSRGSYAFEPGPLTAAEPTPLQVTDCMI